VLDVQVALCSELTHHTS
jgi:hypothetical protein